MIAKGGTAMSKVHRDEPSSPLRLSREHSDFHEDYATGLDIRGIFRALIADEVRQGRLSPFRRRRIIQYAAHLGLSVEEVGSLIAECRSEAEGGDPSGASVLQFDGSSAFVPAGEGFDDAYEEIRRSQRRLGAVVTLITGALIVGWWLFRA